MSKRKPQGFIKTEEFPFQQCLLDDWNPEGIASEGLVQRVEELARHCTADPWCEVWDSTRGMRQSSY